MTVEPATCPASSSTLGECPVSSHEPKLPSPSSSSNDSSNDLKEGPSASSTATEGGAPKAIPHPPRKFIVGNLFDLDPTRGVQCLHALGERPEFRDIYELKILGQAFSIAGSYRMSAALCDESRFKKNVHRPVLLLRDLLGDGLFTAFDEEENWALAHRILLPAFGPLSLKKMQPMMVDTLSQMLIHWEHTAGQPFDAVDQFTRLTLDTIGLCAFRFRFNSFAKENVHPFVDNLLEVLRQIDARSKFPDALLKLRYFANKRYYGAIKDMFDICDELIQERKREPYPDAGDLLNTMLHDKDPRTGKKLSDENIRYQVITFLGAGHETTSGMLSFTTYFLLKHPDTLRKAREEADRLVAEAGGSMLNLDITKAEYIDWVLKEALRLWPTAPGFGVEARHGDEVLPGGYVLKKGAGVLIMGWLVHRDPTVWGEDAYEWRPERWADLGDLNPAAYRPFGNGARACIGRAFAMMEGILALIMILHRFDLELADPDYELKIQETLTVKPEGMQIIARPRFSRNQSLLTELAAGGTAPRTTAAAGGKKTKRRMVENPSGTPINILYGSNAGTCQAFAQSMAEEAAARGLKPFVGELDSVAPDGALPSDGPTLIFVPSYEGQPPDNAKRFVQALKTLDEREKPLTNASYIVIGLGHKDWSGTFHRIPKLVDERLAALGAQRLLDLHVADVSGDAEGDVDAYMDSVWSVLGVADSPGQDAEVLQRVDVIPASANAALSEGFAFGTVLEQRSIFSAGTSHPQTMHTVIELPEGQTYEVGAYLCIMAKNPASSVQRALQLSGLHADDVVRWGSLTVRAQDLFTSYVELGHTAPRSLLPPHLTYDQARAQHYTVLDLMAERALPLAEMLGALPRMKPRHYSISSTPRDGANRASITYTVHTANAGTTLGVSSNYLARLEPGQVVQCAVKPSPGFRLPEPSVPVAMFAAGSGIAPFMGFIAERAATRASETVLWYGCRSAEDVPYAEELVRWASTGALDLRLSFSRSHQASFEGFDVHKGYVQDRVRAESVDFLRLLDDGAHFFVCGSSNRLGAGLKATLVEILGERGDGVQLMDELARTQYKTDVFL